MAISFQAGQLVTAATLNLLAPAVAVKASTQSVTNSATLVDDNDIQFSLLANQYYEIDLWCLSQVTTTTCSLRLAWRSTGTVAAVVSGAERMVFGSADSGTVPPDAMAIQMRAFSLTTNNLNLMTTANTTYLVRERLLLSGGVSGGLVVLQFAQYSAVSGQSTKLMAGTYATCRAVA